MLSLSLTQLVKRGSSSEVEYHLAKVEVTVSKPVSRSRAGVTQPGRVTAFQADGRRFKSCHPLQLMESL